MKASVGGFVGTSRFLADGFIQSAFPIRKHREAFAPLRQVSALFEIQENAGKDFHEVFAALSSETQKTLQAQFGDHSLNEIQSLSQERDPLFFFRGLQEISRRLEDEGRLPAAARLLQFLAAHSSVSQVAETSRSRLEAMQGTGPFSIRAELFLNRLSDEAGNPAVIAGFGLASVLYRISRLGMMAQFLARPTSFWTRGIMAEATSGAFGLLLEAPAFVVGNKGAEQLLGLKPDWSAAAFRHEIPYAYLTFLPLKASGFAFERLSGRLVAGNDLFSRFSRGALPQAGMWVGILGGMGLASLAGIGSPGFKQHWLSESLEMLLHFNMAGLLSRRLLGPNFARWENQMDVQIQNMANPEIFSPLPLRWNDFNGLQPALEGPGLFREPENKPDPKTEGIVWMKGDAPRDAMASASFRPTLDDLQRALGPDHAFLPLLVESQIENGPRLEASLRRLRHAVLNSNPREGRGTYVNWLVRLSLEEVIRKNSAKQLDELFDHLYDGGNLKALERSASELLPSARLLNWPRFVPNFFKSNDMEGKWIDTLPFGPETKTILYRWCMTQKKIFITHPANLPVETFLSTLKDYPWTDSEKESFEKAVQLSANSPLTLYRLYRLHRILLENGDLTLSKLREMGDSDLHLQGFSPSRWHFLKFLRSHPVKLKNTQYDAYLDHSAPLVLLHEIQKRWPKLLDAPASAQRAEARAKKLGPVIATLGGKTHFENEDILQAFHALSDPLSLKIAKEMIQNEFEFKILGETNYGDAVRHFDLLNGEPTSDAPASELAPAYYYPPGKVGVKGVMLLRSPKLKNYSAASLNDLLFETLGKIVHEYKHHLDIDLQKRMELREEMMAFGREYLWRAEHGDVRMLNAFHADGNAGFALHFRDKFEEWYPRSK